MYPPGSETHPQYVQPPVIPGHEFIGEVVKLGPGQSVGGVATKGIVTYWFFLTLPYLAGAKEKYGLDIGDNAIAENIVPCWECRYCLRGRYNMCESVKSNLE